MNFEKNLNDEIEAYLAQYLFCQQRGLIFSAVSDKFKDLIGNVAKYFGNGYVVDNEKFATAYSKALEYLRRFPLYENADWKDDVYTRVLDKLYNLLDTSVL